MGMTNEDKEKLMALKQFISKSGKFDPPAKNDGDGQLHISLQELKVIPHTVFLSSLISEFEINESASDYQDSQSHFPVDLTAHAPTKPSTTSSNANIAKCYIDNDFGTIVDGHERHIYDLLEKKRYELSTPSMPLLGRKSNTFRKVLGDWNPKGNLIAHFPEHRGTVSAIRVSHDQKYFVSSSSDGTIKVWDIQRLITNVTNRARVTYCGHGIIHLILGNGVNDVSFIEGRHSIVSCCRNGEIHINR